MRALLPALCILAVLRSARADLVCPRPTFDAGALRTGAALTHAFVVRNEGRDPVEVRELKAGCGCLKPAIDRRVLRPGEQATVSVEVGTVTQPEGLNRWRVTVRHARGELPLEVLATLTRDVTIRPAALVANTTRPTTHTFTLAERRERPLEVSGASCSCPHMEARVDPPRRDGDGWVRTVALSVRPTCPDGRHEGVVSVHTGDPACRELKVQFTIHQRSPGRVQPAPPAVELVGGGPLPARVVLLGGDGVVLVERVEPSHPAVRCTFAAGPGERSTLRVAVDHQKLPPGPFEGRVKVHLRQPPGATVEVPVRVAR
jgi:hypothetical protein